MDNMKRFVSFLLCFVMLLGFLPANAFAAGETTKTPVDALVVFSDLHIGTTGTKVNNKATLLKSVLNQIKTKVGTVSSVNSAGDMFSSDKSTITSDTDKLNGYIREVFPNVPVNYVWTDHDRAADISKQSTLVEYDNYYIYTLSMGDLSSNDRYRTGFAYSESNNTNRVNSGFTPTVPEAIENFKNAVKNLDKNKPLFIVGHQPLFDNRDENAWAEDWVAAINEVATLMDVTYFSGHNHNYDLNESQTNKQDYYFAKGSTMPVPNRSSWDFNYHSGVQYDSNLSYTNVVLKFTHICAGYMDPATGSNDPDTRKGTALAVEIYEDEIVYTTYNANGVYTGNYAVSESVEREFKADTSTKVESAAPSEPSVEYNEGNNYPEYPDEGAVKVSKTGTGIDFQSSGIARVEISASGVPMKRGVDIILMLDMSSSMKRHSYCGESSCYDRNCDKVTRLAELKEALVYMENYLKESGNADEMRIAIADFNGFYGSGGKSSGTAYDRDSADYMGDSTGPLNSNRNEHRTGVVYNPKTGNTCGIDKDAFVSVSEMEIANVNAQLTNSRATTGTNYDHAFDVIYQLGHAIKTENEKNGEDDRELVVIFMSDGAPNQYNYYHSIGGQSSVSNSDDENYKWNKWLQGRMVDSDYTNSNKTHSYYYDTHDYDEDGIVNEHRMASAIKGDITDRPYYEVIRKNQNGTGKDAVTDLLESTGKENLYKIPGLGATMYSIGFHIKNDGKITEKSVHHVLEQIASTPDKYIMADDETALTKAFNDITSDILYAAYNARYVDQMGKDYDLQMKPLVDLNGNPVGNGGTLIPDQPQNSKIEVIEYDIYTRADYLSGKCTEDQIGDRKGTTPKVLETVSFEFSEKTENGEKVYTVTGAYSSLLGENNNILGSDGIIRAKNFYYNTTNKGVAIEGLDIPTGVNEYDLTTGTTNVLPGETFYWGMGTVKTTELALSYYVYLTGSMEGTREAGSYPTNNYANLYYDNYLDNPAHKDTVSPVLPWKEANVSYAFYLVNEKGQIVVNQTTGTTGSFANKIAVTNPVLYKTITLNSNANVEADVVANNVLPEGYELYDTRAAYEITIHSNDTGNWAITQGENPATTYVMQYDRNNSAAYTNSLTASDTNYDYTHTVVWFAVVWKIQPLPDTVVVDYGLPVDISVLANDMFGANGKLAGVGSLETAGLTLDGHTADNLLSTNPYNGTYGTATVNTTTGKVRYTLNTMEMNSHEQFAYAVSYTGSEQAGYYYDTVTVIPATTIYYEDSFVNYGSHTWDAAANTWGTFVPKDVNGDGKVDNSLWSIEGETAENAVQGEDRPGKYALTDANNIYGYDGVNLGMSTFSLGSAHVATVDYDNYASAQFTFYGTGFDIISMTNSATGTILVDVEKQDANGAWSKFDGFSVDTYYGYKQDADGNWVVNPDANGSIYQVPVIKMADKPYGHYRVTIKATYESFFDHVAPSNDNGSYDFYLDAIRIYDPANDGEGNKVIEDAYVADGEGWPSYIELRNALISAASFDEVANEAMNTNINGLVFIDGDAEVGNAQIADYVSFGPNNEVYLAPGQRVAFVLDTPDNLANVHIGISLATAGTAATYTITNIAKENREGGKVQKGTFYNPKTFQLDTATDMYYDLSGWKGDIIVISNTGDRDENGTTGVIAITNIKSTYKTNPNAAAPQSGDDTMQTENLTRIYMTPAVANVVLDALNTQENTQTPDEPTVPDVPEITEVFEPELFHVKLNKNEIKAGQKVLVTVTTSADVEYVMINGEKITKFIGGGTGNRTWKLNVTGERVGNMTVEVVCCNSKGIASEAVTEKVKVKAKGLLGSLDDILG